MGGPYGAAAGLALGAGRHAGKFLTAAAVLLMLPVLFILMLPSLIFGGLISSGNSGQPILNDNAAIIQNTNDIAFAVNEILGEGITDAEARIAQDFAATSGDNYEIINPYASDMTSNTNSFIAQYCAAKGENWDTISLADMQAILRQGKSSLYSYTRTSETRTVEDDDLDTEDVVETREETWYIYTLSYNGEGYFADTVFHLTDDQKALAGDYAQNLSLAAIRLHPWGTSALPTAQPKSSTSTNWMNAGPTSPMAQTISAAMAADPPPCPLWCPP